MKQTPAYRPSSGPSPGLTRYESAPGSLLSSVSDSVISEGGASGFHSVVGSRPGPDSAGTLPKTRFFTAGGGGGGGESSSHSCLSSSESSGVQRLPSTNFATAGEDNGSNQKEEAAAAAGDGGGGDHLMRQSSSPAGFFSQLMVDNGYSATRGIGQYSHPVTNNIHTMPHTRLKSQLSFASQEPLSQISENNDETDGNVAHSYISNSFSISSWDDTNSIAFSSPSNKRAKNSSEDFIKSLSHIDSQFSLPTTSLEMATVENLFQAQQDLVAFKVRAKRGCATHPRSIAERERRTRISEKLRKLQELVPNMDKQTSTADMLDLAVQHIKELQSQVQNLNQEQANCTCECKKELP